MLRNSHTAGGDQFYDKAIYESLVAAAATNLVFIFFSKNPDQNL
jgi:hypothetical protein